MNATASTGRREAWLARLPFFLLAAAFLALNLRLPYRILNSDVAVFGLMGEDILKHGYLPTLAYGQNYLFSILPYVYAALRWLAPGLSQVMALKLAGCLLNLGGLAFLFEALLLAQRKCAWPRIPAATIFCLLVAGSSSYLFDLQEHSSLEVSLFVLGWIAYFAARLEVCLAENRGGRGLDWFLFGLGLAHALYSRPLVFAYGLMMLIGLLARPWRRLPAGSLRRALLALLAGGALGYLPMLLHLLLRAPAWPYNFHTRTPIGICDKPYPGRTIFWSMVRIIFDLRPEHWPQTIATGLWLVVTGWCALRFLRRDRQDRLSVLDIALPLGIGWILAVMLLIPNLSVNATHRRYCEHIFLVAVWLFARLAPELSRRRWPAVTLAGLVFVTALQGWGQRLKYEVYVNDTLARQLPATVSELESYRAPILADFWDAYLLRFVSDSRLVIEAYPWNFVRTFNAVPESAMRQRVLWLVREDAIVSVKNMLRGFFKPPGILDQGKVFTPQQRLLFRQFEYWEIGAPLGPAEWEQRETGRQQTIFLWDLDPGESRRMLLDRYPQYFTTPYPPRP